MQCVSTIVHEETYSVLIRAGQRKLKCSGEPNGCSRCIRENVTCHYSLQKPMGRPRKRRRDNADHDPVDAEDGIDAQPMPELDPALGGDFPDFPQDAVFAAVDSSDSTLGFDFNLDELPADLFDPSALDAKELSVDQMQAPLAHANGSASIDPAPYPTPLGSTDSAKCFCLSTMFLATSELHKDNPGVDFPFKLGPLKTALNKTDDLMHCEVCPHQMHTLRENTLLVITLLNSIAASFDKLLRDVDAEAVELASRGLKKHLRIGLGLTPQNVHLHTGGPDCPMGMDVELAPQEWRSLAFRSIKDEVFHRGNRKTTLEGLLNQLVARQEAWHEASGKPHMGNSCACIHMTSAIRMSMDALPV